MPSLKKDTKLPVILNQQELKELFAAPTLLKQRIVLALIYSAGLRGQEVINLKISDIDFDRMTIHIRLSKIASCRTATLGGHEEHCNSCGAVRYSYNSCRDRHCPKCQAAKQAFWIEDLIQNTLPIKHYHIVFTVPHQLNSVCLHNQKMYYDLLLFNDKVQQAYHTRWVVHCEPSLANADHVVKYLGQYTHRVAITNQRILNIADGKVTFIAKDYRDGGIKKPVTLDGVEFLRRFTMHILPKRFVKIRRYGIYNHTSKRKLGLQFVPEEKPNIETLIIGKQPQETNQQRFERLSGVDPCLCPVCKNGRMVTVRELPRIRSPDGYFKINHWLKLN